MTSTLGLYCHNTDFTPVDGGLRLNGEPSTYRVASGSIISWINKTIPVDDLLTKNGHVT